MSSTVRLVPRATIVARPTTGPTKFHDFHDFGNRISTINVPPFCTLISPLPWGCLGVVVRERREAHDQCTSFWHSDFPAPLRLGMPRRGRAESLAHVIHYWGHAGESVETSLSMPETSLSMLKTSLMITEPAGDITGHALPCRGHQWACAAHGMQ